MVVLLYGGLAGVCLHLSLASGAQECLLLKQDCLLLLLLLLQRAPRDGFCP
jgi:hypothetical protein